MKYIVVLGDGMADYKLEQLGGKTPLQYANTPRIDALAKMAEVGLCRTVPEGMKPGSDVANLSVLGYDPHTCYTGRSPLEAVSMGIDLKDTDVTLRCNLVTLSDEEAYEDKTMLDYSAGEISTAEARELIEFLNGRIAAFAGLSLHAGISYRHCLVVENGKTGHRLTPPHDITGKPVRGYLPEGPLAKTYLDVMKLSAQLLKDHPVNRARIAAGKRPANSVWLWGEGTKPALENFAEKFGKRGGIISAVDLVKGIGILAGMRIIDVPGATGNYDTNFAGKADAALDALLHGGLDFVYIHMEAPDECGHQGGYCAQGVFRRADRRKSRRQAGRRPGRRRRALPHAALPRPPHAHRHPHARIRPRSLPAVRERQKAGRRAFVRRRQRAQYRRFCGAGLRADPQTVCRVTGGHARGNGEGVVRKGWR